ncbi:MAG: ABC transporter permease [Asgard group archaeon]|nr:ABC transporter permease [Asgard group archaeon]
MNLRQYSQKNETSSMTDEQLEKVEISRRRIFGIFLKTGSKRILLSIIAGTIVFLAITSLCMVLYKHHYTDFIENEAEINWMNDNKLSVMAYHPSGVDNISSTFFDEFTGEFILKLEEIFPDLEVKNYSAATNMQLFHWTNDPLAPWNYYEVMAPDDTIYNALNECLVDGRLPENESELLYINGTIGNYNVSDVLLLHNYQYQFAAARNYTIVGVIDQHFNNTLFNNSLSCDIFDWRDSADMVSVYFTRAVFLTNFTNYQTIFSNISYYNGKMMFLLDAEYDLTKMNLNKFRDYARAFPGSYFIEHIPSIEVSANLAQDLKPFLIDYSSIWISKFSNIIGINAPLLFILGLFCAVTLTIGSKDLDSTFRRMKIYGLSYRNIRSMILLENSIFSVVSLIGGSLIGFFINYLITRNIEPMSNVFYSNFLVDPLYLMSIVVFFVGFFILSFYIQNSIAKKTTRDIHEEYKKKRGKIRSIFSSNEFTLLAISLVFVIISVILFVVHNQYGSDVPLLNTFSYHTLTWFMITCSIALGLTFSFLLLARLFTYFWSLISKWTWKDKLNIITLSIKHISDGRKIYQMSILASLIFALIILPSISMKFSLPIHLQHESSLGTGNANLIIDNWLDPEDELDYIFDNITGLENHTEVTSYRMFNSNEQHYYDKPYEISALAIHNPDTFIGVVDLTLIENSAEYILALKTQYNTLVDYRFARANKLAKVVNITTDRFTDYWRPITLTYVGSFEYFPLTHVIQRNIFKNYERCSLVASRETIREFNRKLDDETFVVHNSIKLIKAVNESIIPIIQAELSSLGYEAQTSDEYHAELSYEINSFSMSNMYFYAFLTIITLIFMGYFTGNKIFDDRLRTIEALYRVGAKRRQILGMYTLELALVNLLPIVVMLFASFPVIRFVSVTYLGVDENYIHFHNYFPAWILVLIIIGGLALIMIGWMIALIPKIYQYKPVKQE